MVISLRKWLQFVKYAVYFAGLTYVLFRLLQTVTVLIAPEDKYREPAGNAVRVFFHEAEQDRRLSMAERLKQFYRYGE
jgi:aspartate/methionine/tyrosine aminotransferase